jgi:hypothetical protein
MIEMARRSSTCGRLNHDDDDEDSDEEDDDVAPSPARPPRRPYLLVIVDVDPGGDRSATLESGWTVPRATLGEWACDCSLGRVVMQGSSQVLDLGRSTRTPSAPQRRAVIARDRHCIVPGCRRKAQWCDVHHVHWWDHGGPTDLENLALICRRHHRLVHRKLIVVLPGENPGTFEIRRPDGSRLHDPPVTAPAWRARSPGAAIVSRPAARRR